MNKPPKDENHFETFDSENDDFDLSDDGSLSGDDLSDVEDYDIDPQISEDYSSSTQAQKSSVNWFNIVMFGGLALAVAGVSYIYLPKLLGSKNETQQSAQNSSDDFQQTASATSNKSLAEAAVTNGLSEEIAKSGGLLANPDMLKDGSNVEYITQTEQQKERNMFEGVNEAADNLPKDKPESETTADITLSDEDLNDIYVPKEVSEIADIKPLPSPSDTNDAVTMPVQKLDDDITFEPLSEQAQTQQPSTQAQPADASASAPTPAPATTAALAPAPATASADVQQQVQALAASVNALSAQLDTFINSVDDRTSQLESRIGQQGGNADVSSLQAEIKRLEQRLETMQKGQPTPVEAVKTPAATPKTMDSIVELGEDDFDETLTTTTQPKKEQTVVEKSEPRPAKEQVEAAPAPTPVVVNTWALRGASPGEAYIANTANGSVRSVSVGETVKGLGRITSIAQENGQWVVRGTRGIVKQ